MQYKYAKEQQDYSDFASGRVFYSLPGHPAFPVRLASEIFQRCLAIRQTIYEDSSPCSLYDPCCGGAYHLIVLAYLHGEHIRRVIASDIDEKAVAVAKQNVGLLSMTGIEKRMEKISQMLTQYRKQSHKEALESAYILKKRLSDLTQDRPLLTQVFQADATDSEAIKNNLQDKRVDIVFTDVPYGLRSHWQASDSREVSNQPWAMLEALTEILSDSSVVAVVSDKGQKASHEGYQRVEQFQIGKRRITILRPVH